MKFKATLIAAVLGSSALSLVPEQAAAFESLGVPQIRTTSTERPKAAAGRPRPSAHQSTAGSRPGAVLQGFPRSSTPFGAATFADQQRGTSGRLPGGPGRVGSATRHPVVCIRAPCNGTVSGTFPRPGSIGSNVSHSSTSGDTLPRPGSIGSKTSHLGSLSHILPGLGSTGSKATGGTFPRPGSIGGGHAGKTDVLNRFFDKTGLGKGRDPLRDPTKPVAGARAAGVVGGKAKGHAAGLAHFGKNPVETAKDVGALEVQLKDAKKAQQEKTKALTDKQGAEAAAAAAFTNAGLQLTQAMASGNPVAIASAQAALVQAKATAEAAGAARAQAASDLSAAEKTTAGIRKDLTQNREILDNQIKIERLQAQLSQGQANGPVTPAVVPVDPGPAPVGPAPAVVGPTPVDFVPAPAVAPAPQLVAAPIPAAAPVATAPVAAQAAPQFVSVMFKPDLSAANLAAFLQAYKVTIVEGPSRDNVYKLRLDDPLPADQLPQLIDSMKGQTAIVSDAAVS